MARRKKENDEGRGDPSCVVLPESSVNSVGRGVALCVVRHGVLRRVETSHAKRYKHEEAREFRTHASHNVRNDGLYAKPPREMLEGPVGHAFPVPFLFIHPDILRTSLPLLTSGI